jgi:hypothetical protein
VLITTTVGLLVNECRSELAVRSLHGEQFDATNSFGGNRLIVVHVCGLSTDHTTPARKHGLQAEHVRTGSVEHGEHLNAHSEVSGHHLVQVLGVDILAIGDLMSTVHRGKCLKNSWVNAGIVI